MLVAEDADFDARPRTGLWTFATRAWEQQQDRVTVARAVAAEEKMEVWQANACCSGGDRDQGQGALFTTQTR